MCDSTEMATLSKDGEEGPNHGYPRKGHSGQREGKCKDTKEGSSKLSEMVQ